MSINIRDDATGQIATLVGSQLQKQLNFAEQASAATGGDYKFTLKLEMLDGGNGAITPVVLEQWDLEGCYLESVNYNTVNYGTSEVVTIALTVQYDNAIQVINGTTSTAFFPRNVSAGATGEGTTGGE
jgi:hypothetical protein